MDKPESRWCAWPHCSRRLGLRGKAPTRARRNFRTGGGSGGCAGPTRRERCLLRITTTRAGSTNWCARARFTCRWMTRSRWRWRIIWISKWRATGSASRKPICCARRPAASSRGFRRPCNRGRPAAACSRATCWAQPAAERRAAACSAALTFRPSAQRSRRSIR